MVDFKDLVSQALQLSTQGNRKNYLGAIILAHTIIKDPEVITDDSGPKIPYSIIQSAMIHYNQVTSILAQSLNDLQSISTWKDTKEPIAGTINQELASKKMLKLLKK